MSNTIISIRDNLQEQVDKKKNLKKTPYREGVIDGLLVAIADLNESIAAEAEWLREKFDSEEIDQMYRIDLSMFTDEELCVISDAQYTGDDSDDNLRAEIDKQKHIKFHEVIELDELQWFENYKPVDDQGLPAEDFNSIKWYDNWKDVPLRYRDHRQNSIWTDTDSTESDRSFLQSGLHLVNANRWCISAVPVSQYVDVQVKWEENNE